MVRKNLASLCSVSGCGEWGCRQEGYGMKLKRKTEAMLNKLKGFVCYKTCNGRDSHFPVTAVASTVK